MENKALGKGLKALIPDAASTEKKEEIVYLDVAEIRPNRYQPRERFSQKEEEDLKNSIKERGVIQPVLVRRKDSAYELIAGERRLRAVKALGIAQLPAIIKDVTDSEALELALVENLQREGLNPIEEAHAFQRLADEFEYTQDKIAQAVGKDRATVSNILRLLKLPPKIQDGLSQGVLTMGHARAILSLPDTKEQIAMYEKILQKEFSVREAEVAVKNLTKPHKRHRTYKDPEALELEAELQRILGTRVKIYAGKKRGRIEIDYLSLKDFERILKLFRSIKKT